MNGPSRAQRPDGESFAGLAQSYRAPLVRFFSRNGLSREAAEDCVQDVFARLSKLTEGEVDNPEAYIFKIAKSVLIDRGRRARVRLEGLHDPIGELDLASPESGPGRILEGREALQHAAKALGELPERTRNIFLLNRLDGLTYTQLAARYAVSVKAIERDMSRALSHLRQRFAEYDRS